MSEAPPIELGLGVLDTEQASIDAAIGGNAQAFVVLYDHHVARVYRYVYYHVGNRADAEDLTQQVFLQAWQAIGRYRRTRATFLAWLLTIAHHLVVKFYQRTKEAHPLDPEAPGRARWMDPEAEVLARLDQLAVRRAVLRLSPQQQLVITMRFLKHLDYADIAAALGKREGNIRVIQHRALLELGRRSGVMAAAERHLPAKKSFRGLGQGQCVESFVLLSAPPLRPARPGYCHSPPHSIPPPPNPRIREQREFLRCDRVGSHDVLSPSPGALPAPTPLPGSRRRSV